jgi:glycosyltransferase involved in cell wall biosynthesis
MSATEGNGKVLNYMSMALPVVAFDTPVNRELLGDLGLYASFGDSRQLAERLLDGLREPLASRRLGMALRARAAACFSWCASIVRLESVYRTLLGSI